MKNRIKELRKKNNLSLREVDEKVNINYSQLARIERGESFLTQQHIETLSSFFGVSSDYLLGLSDDKKSPSTGNIFKLVPLIKEINNGFFDVTSSTEYLTAEVINKENYIFYQIKDSSMSPLFLKDDYILIYLSTEIKNNDLVLININHSENVIRRFKKINNKNILLSENNEFDPIIFDSKVNKVIGICVSYFRPKIR